MPELTDLNYVDYLVIASYMAATMAIGFWVGSYVRSGSDFFLAGRTLPWWAVGMSLVATDIGGTDLVGVGGDAYRYGIVMGNFEWIGCVPAMIVAAFVFAPHLWRCKVTTIPEYLERRFSVHLRTLVAIVWLVLMACNLGVMLLASARFMHSLAGWDVTWTILSMAIVVGIYTWSGGLGAVVYTDVLQGFVMIFGCALIVILGIIHLGGLEAFADKVHEAVQRRQLNRQTGQTGSSTNSNGYDTDFGVDPRDVNVDGAIRGRNGNLDQRPDPNVANPVEEVRPEKSLKKRRRTLDEQSTHLSLVLPVDTPSPGPWPAILFGLALIVSPGYWIGNQTIIQRSLGAKSEYEAGAAYVYGALLKTLIPFLIVVPGLIALVMFPKLGDSGAEHALPYLVKSLLPQGFRGIFIAAFMAALMSSVDSYLNSATTIYVNDFYKRFFRPGADEGQMLVVGRWVTVGFVAWAIYFAFQLAPFGVGIYSIFQTLMSFVVGPTLAVMLAGMLSSRATAEGALPGFVAGVLTSTGLMLMNQPFVYKWLGDRPLFRIEQPYLYYSIWAFLATIVITATFSYFSRPCTAENARYSIPGWRPEGDAS